LKGTDAIASVIIPASAACSIRAFILWVSKCRVLAPGEAALWKTFKLISGKGSKLRTEQEEEDEEDDEVGGRIKRLRSKRMQFHLRE